VLEYEIKRLPDGQLLSFVKDKSNAVAVRKNNKEITLKLGRGGQLFGISAHSSYNIVNNASILARESPKKIVLLFRMKDLYNNCLSMLKNL